METIISPPQNMLIKHNLPTEGWKPVYTGMVAVTFLHEQYVVQKRPLQALSAYQAAEAYLRTYATESLFAGAITELLEIESDGFWIVTDRLDSPDDQYVFNTDRDNHLAWWEWGKEIWPTALETMRLIKTKPALPDTVLRNPKRITSFKLLPIAYIRQVLNARGAELTNIPEHHFETDLVVSHGDLHASNIVRYKEGGYRTIDWETLAMLPEHSDPSQFIVYLLAKTPSEEWSNYFWSFSKDCQELTGLNSIDWAAVLVEAILRETALWSELIPVSSEMNTFDDNITGIKKLLKEF